MTRRGPIELPASAPYAWCVRWDGRGWRGELRADIRIVGPREPSRTVLAAIEMYAPSRAAPGSNGGVLEPGRQGDVADAHHEQRDGDGGEDLPLFGELQTGARR